MKNKNKKAAAEAAQAKAMLDAAPVSAAVQSAINRLYDVFGSYRAPKELLDVCIPCCMDLAVEKEMHHVPLRKLTAAHFYAYNDTAKSTEQPVDEMRYFLPRLLELLAHGAQLHHSPELYLQRLGNCDPLAFSKDERAAIDAFALAYWSDFLSQHSWQNSSGYLPLDAFDVLLMLDLGGIDVQPLLSHWLSTDSAAASLHFVSAGYWGFFKAHGIENAFANERPAFRETMKKWVMDPKCREIFSARLLNLDVSQLQQAGDIDCGAQLRPQDLIDGVFQNITW